MYTLYTPSNMSKVGKEVKPVSEEEMVDLEQLKRDKFTEKHPPIPDEEIPEKIKDREDAKAKYTRDIQKIEDNLTVFFEKDYPMIDPESGEVLCWIKDIQYFKLLAMIPDEVLEEMDKAEDEVDMAYIIKQLKEHSDNTFKIMAEVIVIPKHDWEWWKEHSNQTFLDLFNDFLEKRITKINQDVSFF